MADRKEKLRERGRGQDKIFSRAHPNSHLLPPVRSYILNFAQPVKIVPPVEDQASNP
jgi:hypothetical protein